MVGRPSRKIHCGAARKYDGNPCQAKALANGRCKYHGGMSTGAKTLDGKIKAYSKLKQFQSYNEEQIKRYIEERHQSKLDEWDTTKQDLFISGVSKPNDSV